jgi:hypothetical protein
MEDSLDQCWTSYASDLKASHWDLFSEDQELFYDKFSPITGDVVDDWSFARWTLDRVAGIKPFGTQNCITVTSFPRGRK